MNRRVATAFIDCLFLLLLVLILLPHQPAPRATPQVDLFSRIIVGIRWPDASKADIDLWVRAPGDGAVGYSRTRGNDIGLMWDDIGTVSNPPWRFEAIMGRAAPDGEYVVNVHAYTFADHPVPVQVAVWRKTPNGVKEFWSGEVTLVARGQEITAIRFTLQGGEPIPGSFHSDPVAIRADMHNGQP